MLYGVVIVVFGKVYPTEPNAENTTHLLSEKEVLDVVQHRLHALIV
jgi:hypothetical protein